MPGVQPEKLFDTLLSELSEDVGLYLKRNLLLKAQTKIKGLPFSEMKDRKLPKTAVFQVGFYLCPLIPAASLPINVNNGKYIAITIPPIVTPKNTIKSGSIKESISAIAASTSSS